MHQSQSRILARHVASEIRVDAANSASEWQSAQRVCFFSDWQGKNADPELETEVRVLWSPAFLYLRFVCRYRELVVFDDSDINGRRDHLWDRDVAEAFLQPNVAQGSDRTAPHVAPGVHARTEEGVDARRHAFYKEFEVAPNGMWIDLDISPSGLNDLKSGLTRSVHVDAERKIWTAELAIPMKRLTAHFDPNQAWRANFYRVEGKIEPRKYMAWQPTYTLRPNFHVPESFGTLRFEGESKK